MESRLDLDLSLETPGAGAVSREGMDSVTTVSQVIGGILGELGWGLSSAVLHRSPRVWSPRWQCWP